ncbi:MAG: hypothetical protein ACFB8W_17900 [Elainellaceae cyanobacterium]
MNSPTSRLDFLLQTAVWIGTLGSGLALTAQPVAGQALPSRPPLLAQQVIDGLPPPPPIPDLQQSPPAIAPAPQSPTGSNQTNAELLYLVYVNGDSPLLLEQVRQVEPTAIVQDYGGQAVIVAGVFEDRDDAEDQADALEDQGIEAEIVAAENAGATSTAAANSPGAPTGLPALPPADISPAVPRPPELQSPAPAPTRAPAPVVAAAPQPVQDSSYYIVVPGDSDRLPQMQEQVILLGARQSAIAQRERPLGPHLLIGPFVDRSAATRWNRFLRDFGMDARVYYKR